MSTKEEKQEEKVILSKEDYKNLLKMLNSEDAENHVVALSIIDNCDIIKSKVLILLLRKKGKAALDMWKEHAATVIKVLKSNNTDLEKLLTYQSLLDNLLTCQTPEKDIEFFLAELSDDLKQNIKAIGYNFIEDIQIELKLKDNVKRGE